MLSIIVPTFNRAGSLFPTLASLVAQDFPANNFEILIVDNGSTDTTKLVSEQFIAQNPSHQIQYLYEPEPGQLSGRHRGTLGAHGDILVFVDDDIEADINWLQSIEEAFANPSIQLVGGRNLPRYEGAPPEWVKWFWQDHPYGRCCGYLSLLDFGNQAREIDPDFIWGLNFSIRKQALHELGGFHPDCIPRHLQHFQGDGEGGLTRKAKKSGYKALYQPRALVFHRVSQERMTYAYFDQRSFYQGVSVSYMEIRGSGRPKEASLEERGKSLLRPLKRQLLRAIQTVPKKWILKQRFGQAWLQGYQFHQTAARKNPALMEWILKSDYWDYRLPQIPIDTPRRRL